MMSMSAEQDGAESVPQLPHQVEGRDGEQDAPVLQVSQLSPSQPRLDDHTRDEEAAASNTVSTQTEPPPRGASDLWGLDEQMDGWQVSTIPEEKHYFSMDPNLFAAAITAIRSRLTETDSNIRGAWLVTEIDHWDLEKEKMLVLADNNIISVRYNFIQGLVEELKFIPITAITNIAFGDFKYPNSYAYARTGKALKIFWGKEETVGFLDRWNPFSGRVPYTIFASHLMLRKGRVDNDRLRIAKVVPELEKAINDLRRAQPPPQQEEEEDEGSSGSPSSSNPPAPAAVEEYHVNEEDIVINAYVGMSALVHNGSNLGFFKRRGLMNW